MNACLLTIFSFTNLLKYVILVAIGGVFMNLYNIYNICSSAPFPGIQVLSSILCLGSIAQLRKYLKSHTIPEFLSDTIFKKFSICKRKILAILINLLIIFSTIFGSNYFVVGILGCDDIRVMPDGVHCYYVLATNKKGKTYTLPAEVYTGFGEYHVTNIYFKNGGYLDLGDCYIEKYGSSNIATDQNDRIWEIKLTNNKTTHPDVDETIPYTTANDYIVLVIALLHILMIIMHIFFWNKSHA